MTGLPEWFYRTSPLTMDVLKGPNAQYEAGARDMLTCVRDLLDYHPQFGENAAQVRVRADKLMEFAYASRELCEWHEQNGGAPDEALERWHTANNALCAAMEFDNPEGAGE